MLLVAEYGRHLLPAFLVASPLTSLSSAKESSRAWCELRWRLVTLCLCPTGLLSDDRSPQISACRKGQLLIVHGAPKTVFGGSLASICL